MYKLQKGAQMVATEQKDTTRKIIDTKVRIYQTCNICKRSSLDNGDFEFCNHEITESPNTKRIKGFCMDCLEAGNIHLNIHNHVYANLL